MKGRKTVWKSVLLTVMLLAWMCLAVPALAEEASGDNSLSSLGITTEGVTVSPDFYYSTIEYQVTVPNGTSRLELDPVTSNSGASILSIDGQDIGSDGTTTVAITVQAANGNQITYYLYVTTDTTTQAATPAAETETEAVTEAQTETEPETEDPRYVKVDRNALEEAEKTISTLKTETGNYRDRVTLLTRILYGMIALCVILLFAVINLVLKKKDLKAELQNYMGYGYDPGAGEADGGSAQQDYDNGAYAQQGYDNGYDAPQQSYDNGYDAPQNYDDGAYAQPHNEPQAYAGDGYPDAQADFADPFGQPQPLSKKEQKKLKKEQAAMADDPATVPKPSRAKKKAKQMPEYQAPQPQHQYEPPKEKTSEDVKVNMIDL
ncbi:MAG: cadherin-like beta sandwich domain-containing protein [Lachnospiraceae bacterium]|nr:cadherin-like beta sandwich domain-containing protein [Lachnospiraceae bacterium]